METNHRSRSRRDFVANLRVIDIENKGVLPSPRPMKQYSPPPYFHSLKGISFLPLLIIFEAEPLGMGWDVMGRNVMG